MRNFLILSLSRAGFAVVVTVALFFESAAPAAAAVLFDGNYSSSQSVTNTETFILDQDDSGTNLSLQFGRTLNESLQWNNGTSQFDLSDDLNVSGVVTAAGVTSTATVNFSGSGAFRIRENSNPAANSACATVGELILDTTDNEIQVCTVTGGAGAATWVAVKAGDANTLDGVDSGSFLRSDTSDTFTSGTLTTDNGTTLAVAGTANIGDGGDDVFINSNDWDVSSTGVASGFTGFTSTGTIDFTGATAFSPAQGTSDPGTCTEGQQFYNSTSNTLKMCTATNTWTSVGGGGS